MLKDSQKSKRFARLAHVLKAHGKNGEVSVQADSPEQNAVSSAIFNSLASSEHPIWIVPPPTNNRCLHLKSVRGGSNDGSSRLIVGFHEIDKRTVARELAGHHILVERSKVPDELLNQLDQAQVIAEDIAASETYGLNLEVHSDSHGHLGTVAEVIETGANLVWVVHGSAYGEVLLPVIDDCVLSVDEQANIATVYVMDGLIDKPAKQDMV
ncbi:MAG: hypothetical protein FWC81_03485 [Coriobacteriia bacterium]|nr:hypothetical protein [Coriobacteriia bacterium]